MSKDDDEEKERREREMEREDQAIKDEEGTDPDEYPPENMPDPD